MSRSSYFSTNRLISLFGSGLLARLSSLDVTPLCEGFLEIPAADLVDILVGVLLGVIALFSSEVLDDSEELGVIVLISSEELDERITISTSAIVRGTGESC